MAQFVVLHSENAYVDPFVAVHRAGCDCPTMRRALVEDREGRDWFVNGVRDEATARRLSEQVRRRIRAGNVSWSDCALFATRP